MDAKTFLSSAAFADDFSMTYGNRRTVWGRLMCYTLEKSCAWTTLIWGGWLLVFRPISENSPSMRGAHLMNEVFSWTWIPSDIVWGLAVAIPAVLQILLIPKQSSEKIRGFISLHCAAVYLFVTILLLAVNWKTMGFAMYMGLAFGHFACYAQLTQKRIIVNGE